MPSKFAFTFRTQILVKCYFDRLYNTINLKPKHVCTAANTTPSTRKQISTLSYKRKQLGHIRVSNLSGIPIRMK